MTSAPLSERSMPATGPAIPQDKSSTRIPSRTLVMDVSFSLSGGEDGAGPAGRHQHGAGVGDLVDRRPPQLAGALEHQVQPVDIALADEAAVRGDRQGSVRAQVSRRHEILGLPGPAE